MKNYYLYSLLTFTTHAGCTHSQPLDMKGQRLNRDNGQQQFHHLARNTAIEEQQRAVAFCKLMKRFVQKLSCGTSSRDLIEQHVLDQFPELLDSFPTTAQPVDTGPIVPLIDPEKQIDIAMAMYQYMKEVIQSIGYVKVSVPSVADKYKYYIGNTYTNQYVEQLIDEFLCKFPQLLITPVDGEIALFEAIRQGGSSVALRLLNLLETIDQKTGVKINLVTKVLNHQNYNRYTPLMFLAFSERENVGLMKKMLRLGAKLDVANNSNRTVMHVCVQENNPQLLTAIFQHIFASKVKGEQEKKEEALNLICQPDEKDITPLMLAAEKYDYQSFLKILADYWFSCTATKIPSRILEIAREQKANQNVVWLEEFNKECLLRAQEELEAAKLEELEAARLKKAAMINIKEAARIRKEEARSLKEARMAALATAEQERMRKEKARILKEKERASFKKRKKESSKKSPWTF